MTSYRFGLEEVCNSAETSSTAKSSKWTYLPEIDGLRSIAVLSVIAFHFDRRILSGGFVGVDIFFVISGFLITSVLLRDIDQGRPSIARFYQHRIARIAPAFFLVLFVTVVVGAYFYSAQDFASLGANSLAAALSIINMKLMVQGSYFRITPDAQPLLHYWTLSIEEQFYLIFPLYLYLCLRIAKSPLSVTLMLCALSFAGCMLLTPIRPVVAFYLLPTRAWELLAGSCLALFRENAMSGDSKRGPLTALCGVGLLAFSFVFIRQGENFPGWVAGLPVVGTVLILASIDHQRRHIVQRLLAHPVPVFIGRRSYSLYLWHWPIFSFVDYRFFLSSYVTRDALKIPLCIAATLLTFRLVERPMRSYLNVEQRRPLAFGGVACAVVVACVCGSQIRSQNYLSAEARQIADGGIAINSNRGESVALIGDSEGAMYGRELASLARARGFSLNVLSMAAANELPEEPETYWPAVKQFLAAHHQNVVVIAEAWTLKLGSDTRYLQEALNSISASGSQVVLVAQPPLLPPMATREAMRAGIRPPFFEEPDDRLNRERVTTAITRLASHSVMVIDPAYAFFEHNGAIRLVSENGRLTYHDQDHLSDSGTVLVRPMLEKALGLALSAR